MKQVKVRLRMDCKGKAFLPEGKNFATPTGFRNIYYF